MTLDSLKHLFKVRSRVSVANKIFLVQQLQIMTKAGVPLTSALMTLSDQAASKALKEMLHTVGESVEKGKTFAEALRPHTEAFGELMVNMIAAGESSGRLEEVLGQLHVQMKKDHAIVSKVRGAMIYPAVVVVAMVVIGTGMMIFVIPKLTLIFKESNVDLPIATKVLIVVSDFMAANALLIIPAALILVSLFMAAIHRPAGKKIWHWVLLKAPVTGPIVRKVNMARFARTVSAFLHTDIPIVQTLQTTANVLGNVHYQEALRQAAVEVGKGTTLSDSLRASPELFNPTILQMVAVGEQAGSLDDVLVEAAGFYEDEVDQTMTSLPQILEPILMVGLGVAVGFMAVAVIMPLYKLAEAI
jgi:type IV pilus assembly protein PilC